MKVNLCAKVSFPVCSLVGSFTSHTKADLLKITKFRFKHSCQHGDFSNLATAKKERPAFIVLTPAFLPPLYCIRGKLSMTVQWCATIDYLMVGLKSLKQTPYSRCVPKCVRLLPSLLNRFWHFLKISDSLKGHVQCLIL